MAAAPQKQTVEVEALIRRLQRSREDLGHHYVELQHKLDLPSRIKHSVRRNPLVWFGGSAGLGLLSTRLFRRPKKAVKKSGKLGFLIATTFTILKPTLTRVITSELQRRFIGHAQSNERRLPLSKNGFPRSKE